MPSRHAASVVRAAKLEERCLELRASGLSFREIAAEAHVSVSGAFKAVARGLREVNLNNRAEAADLRQLEGARLDKLQESLWAEAEAGDPRAVDAVLDILARRARLFGLDAPREKTRRVVVSAEEMDQRRRDLVAHLLADVAAGRFG